MPFCWAHRGAGRRMRASFTRPRGRCAMRYVTSMPAAFLMALLSAGGAGAEDATITIESRTVRADDLSFEVRLDTDVPLAGTNNDIVFDPPALLAARANGRPLCVVNDSIEKGATQFSFGPTGCA